jgi:hypothetical protein
MSFECLDANEPVEISPLNGSSENQFCMKNDGGESESQSHVYPNQMREQCLLCYQMD